MKIIRIQDMVPGVRYIVAKGTSCKTLQQGDHVWGYENGDLACLEARGWLEPGTVAKSRSICCLDTNHYRKRIEKCREEIAEAERLIKEDREA